MSVRRMQGWALIASALLGLLVMLRSDSSVAKILLTLGTVLLILGVPAIGSFQRLGTVGLVGIVLIEIAAIIALGVSVLALAGISDVILLASALAGALGRVVVGWIASREKVFPAWAGWAFIAEGVLNLIGGLIATPAIAAFLGMLLPLIGAVAFAGFGLVIIRHDEARTALTEPVPALTKK